MKRIIVIGLISCLSFYNGFSQSIYELDLSDPSTFTVTCSNILNPSHWTVYNQKCSLYTPLIPVSSSCMVDSMMTIPVTLRINQSGNLIPTDYALLEYYQDGNWILLDSIIGSTVTANSYYVYEVAHHFGDLFGLRVTFFTGDKTRNLQLSDGDIVIYDPCVSLLPLDDEMTATTNAECTLLEWRWFTEPDLSDVELWGGESPTAFYTLPVAYSKDPSQDGMVYSWRVPVSVQTSYYQARGTTFTGEKIYSDLVAAPQGEVASRFRVVLETGHLSFNFDAPESSMADVFVFHSGGSLMHTLSVELKKGSNVVRLPLALSTGIYFVMVQLKDQQFSSSALLQ